MPCRLSVCMFFFVPKCRQRLNSIISGRFVLWTSSQYKWLKVTKHIFALTTLQAHTRARPSNQPEIKFVLISFRTVRLTFSVAIFSCVTQSAVERRQAGENRLIILHARILFEHITIIFSSAALRFHSRQFSRSPNFIYSVWSKCVPSRKARNPQITDNPLVVNNLNILPDTIVVLLTYERIRVSCSRGGQMNCVL